MSRNWKLRNREKKRDNHAARPPLLRQKAKTKSEKPMVKTQESDDKTAYSGTEEDEKEETIETPNATEAEDNKTVIPAGQDADDVARLQDADEQEEFDEYEKKSDNELGEELKQALHDLARMSKEDENKESKKALETFQNQQKAESYANNTTVLMKEDKSSSACTELFQRLGKRSLMAELWREKDDAGGSASTEPQPEKK